MTTLAIDTSSALSVALVDGDAVLAAASAYAPRGHAELLAPMVRDVLAEAGVASPSSIVVGTGPAPFTGLRVGLVTARTLGLAWDVEVLGVCSLDALGAAHGAEATVIADARRREVYWARYESGRPGRRARRRRAGRRRRRGRRHRPRRDALPRSVRRRPARDGVGPRPRVARARRGVAPGRRRLPARAAVPPAARRARGAGVTRRGDDPRPHRGRPRVDRGAGDGRSSEPRRGRPASSRRTTPSARRATAASRSTASSRATPSTGSTGTRST